MGRVIFVISPETVYGLCFYLVNLVNRMAYE